MPPPGPLVNAHPFISSPFVYCDGTVASPCCGRPSSGAWHAQLISGGGCTLEVASLLTSNQHAQLTVSELARLARPFFATCSPRFCGPSQLCGWRYETGAAIVHGAPSRPVYCSTHPVGTLDLARTTHQANPYTPAPPSHVKPLGPCYLSTYGPCARTCRSKFVNWMSARACMWDRARG